MLGASLAGGQADDRALVSGHKALLRAFGLGPEAAAGSGWAWGRACELPLWNYGTCGSPALTREIYLALLRSIYEMAKKTGALHKQQEKTNATNRKTKANNQTGVDWPVFLVTRARAGPSPASPTTKPRRCPVLLRGLCPLRAEPSAPSETTRPTKAAAARRGRELSGGRALRARQG